MKPVHCVRDRLYQQTMVWISKTFPFRYAYADRNSSVNGWYHFVWVLFLQFLISSRVKNNEFLEIYKCDPAKTFLMYVWNQSKCATEVSDYHVSCNTCVIHKQTACFYLKTEEYLTFYFIKFHNSHTDIKFMKNLDSLERISP